jgi:HD-like signal output (HDOD) protein
VPAQRRILFVDDEQPVLDGLRDALRRQRERWDMVFVCGGVAGLAALGAAPFDVVVADLRMPEVDGATLLARARHDHPATLRIALSGHADRRTLDEIVSVAQQFLAKPCEPERLRTAIERGCDLQQWSADPRVHALVGQVDRLPAVPAIYAELTTAIARDDVGVREIAAIVERDPATSAKILQLVNSAFFGTPRRITAVAQAVGMLGAELVRGLALAARLFDDAQTPAASRALADLQQRAVVAASLARALAPAGASDAAFTAGLLLEIGLVLLWAMRPALAAQVAIARRGPGDDAVRDALGVDHPRIGAYLLGAWALPADVVEAVALHREPGGVRHGGVTVLAAAHAASSLIADPTGATLDREFLDAAGLSGQVASWRATAARVVEGRA